MAFLSPAFVAAAAAAAAAAASLPVVAAAAEAPNTASFVPGAPAAPFGRTTATTTATTTTATAAPSTALGAAPKRLEENADGVLYVNDRCINCAACANFAPDVFGRAPSDTAHVVHTQPSASDLAQLHRSRAALAACPVAAIRVENSARMNHANRGDRLSEEDERLANMLAISPRLNGLDAPFPRPLLEAAEGRTAADGGEERVPVYYLGHHNEESFGAVPYLAIGEDHNGERVSVMVDAPKFTPGSVRAVLSLTGERGPDYLLLTHVDDTAHHGKWREEFPNLKRIFHAGDLGRYNWLNDETLEEVEVLLRGTTEEDAAGGRLFKAWNLDGEDLADLDDVDGDFAVLHTPGHSPGSISLLFRPGGSSGRSSSRTKALPGILFTGDTLAYSTRDGGAMTGFPRYSKMDLNVQAQTLRKLGLLAEKWDVVAPGHGHPRNYGAIGAKEGDGEDRKRRRKLEEIEEAIEGFAAYRRRFAVR